MAFYQGHVLSPLLILTVMEVISKELQWCLGSCCCMQIMILMAESADNWCKKTTEWKSGMEAKGLKMNSEKQK